MPSHGADQDYLEEGRLNTFDDAWPHKEGSLNGENMAKAGFSYLKRNDIVTCFCCFIKIGGWETEDDPWARHIELSPDCIFAQLAKEEGELTVTQFCDVMCARSIAMLDLKFKHITKLQEKLLASEQPGSIVDRETITNENGH